MVDESIERLLGYHRRSYWLENGWSLRFLVWRTPVTAEKPHGMRYSLTLHDVDGTRLMGFDNAHGIGRETRFDHEYRYGRVSIAGYRSHPPLAMPTSGLRKVRFR